LLQNVTKGLRNGWIVWNDLGSGNLKALAKYNLVTVQEVRWVEGGSQPAHYTFFYGNGNANHHIRIEIISPFTRV
jgi:hypothetical protein